MWSLWKDCLPCRGNPVQREEFPQDLLPLQWVGCEHHDSPWAYQSTPKLTLSHRYCDQLFSADGPGTHCISLPWDLVRTPTLGHRLKRDSALLSTPSPTTCLAQRQFPCSSESEQAPSGENLDPVATLTKCDLAEKGSHHLSAARVDLAQWVVPTGQRSLKPAAMGLS